MAFEPVNTAIFHAHGDHAAAFAIFHNQVECEIFDKEIRIIFQTLLIQGMQHCMARAVRSSGSTLNWGAFAHILHMPAKRTLVDGTVCIT